MLATARVACQTSPDWHIISAGQSLMRILSHLLLACLIVSPALAQIEDESSESLVKQLKDSDLNTRRDAVYELVRRRDTSKEVLRGLADLANDRDEQLQFQALMGLGRAGKAAEVALPELLDAMKDRSDQPRYRASIALGNIGKPAVEPMCELWKEASSDTKVDLAKAFFRMGQDAAAANELLVAALQDGSESVQSHAAEALLRTLPAEKQLSMLLQLTEHPLAVVRRTGVRALGKQPNLPEEAMEGLSKLINDLDPRVRENAVIAVLDSRLPEDARQETLLNCVTDQDESVRLAARALIGKYGWQNAAFAKRIIGALKKTDDPLLQNGLLETLASFGPGAAGELQSVVDLAAERNFDLQKTAAVVVAMGPNSMRDLMRSLQQRPDLEQIVASTFVLAGNSAKPVLIDGLRSKLPLLQAAATKALGDARIVDKELAAQIRANAASGSIEVRSASFVALAQIMEAAEEQQTELELENWESLLGDTFDSAPAPVQESALANLWAFPVAAKSKERMLKNALGDKAIGLKAAALRSLAKEEPQAKRLKKEIIATCQDQAAEVRLAALQCLAELGESDKAVEITVLDGLKDSEPKVRIAATQCMVALEILNEQTAKAVEQNLGDDTELLNSSLESVPKFGERAKQMIPSLANLLRHPEERTRMLSIEALAAAESDEGQLTDRLKDSLEDSSWNVRQKTAETLGELGGDAVAAVPQLFQLIDNEEDESFATAALREIDAAPATALPVLVDALGSENRRKQFYAVYLIGKMGADAEEVIPRLREELKESKNSRNASSRRKYLSQAIESIEKAVREKQEADGKKKGE